MNAAYWLAVIWGLLAVASILFTKGRNAALVWLLASASVIASLLGVAISYHLI
jgi:hypothetical protein